MLYTRQINQEDGSREYSDPYFWKVIKVHRLDNRSIMGVVSMDGKLIIMSIVQRVNVPTANTSPTMVRSVSACSLKAGLKSPVGSKGSRPSSLDKDVYVPVANMKYAKCASGSVSFNGKLVVCGGFDRGECLNKVEAYNAEINAWEKWPSMLSKRGRFDATVVDDKLIYAVGNACLRSYTIPMNENLTYLKSSKLSDFCPPRYNLPPSPPTFRPCNILTLG